MIEFINQLYYILKFFNAFNGISLKKKNQKNCNSFSGSRALEINDDLSEGETRLNYNMQELHVQDLCKNIQNDAP